ncbi:MAG: flagellar hook-length control protein FliK [Bacillota bacterium]
MKITPLLHMMNQSANPIKTSTNPAGLSFSQFLVGDQGDKQISSLDKKVPTSESLSLQQITDVLSLFLTEFSLTTAGLKSSVDQEEQVDRTQSSTVTLLENEISGSLSEAYSVEELIDQVRSSPTAVGVLSLVKVIEQIPTDHKVDFKPFLTKLNRVLENEYPSYNNTDTIQFLSMIQAIDNMKPNDKALIKGQITIGKLASGDEIDRLTIVDTLLSINNKLKEAILLGKKEFQVKKEIFSDLEAVTQNKHIKNRLQAVFEKADLVTLQTLFNKTVEKLFGEELTHTLNNFDNEEQYMTVGQINNLDKKGTMFFNDDSVENLIHSNSSLIDDQNEKVKIETMLQEEFTVYKLSGMKGSLLENNHLLFEELNSKWIKQDEKTLSENSLGDIETYSFKTNESTDGLILNGNSRFSSGQQMIDLAFSKINLQESNKQVDIKEESYTIQLDKFIIKQSSIPVENQKTESSTRQEFTNQLLNAFKTSKFAQLPNGANRLVIKLNPEHLGSLTVRLVQKNGEMIARIVTSSESAKELLDHSVHQLRQALPSIQVEIERFDVNIEQLAKTFRDDSEQREKHEKEFDDSRPEEEQEKEQSFMDSLKEALNTTV